VGQTWSLADIGRDPYVGRRRSLSVAAV